MQPRREEDSAHRQPTNKRFDMPFLLAFFAGVFHPSRQAHIERGPHTLFALDDDFAPELAHDETVSLTWAMP
jgi:hypothetical protein